MGIYNFIRFGVPTGIKNLIRFFPVIWNHRPYDYIYVFILLKESLYELKENIKNGYEIKETRDKKVIKIERCIEILNNIIEDNYMQIAEIELGYKVKLNVWDLEDDDESTCKENLKIYELSEKIKEKEFKELLTILEGQKHSHFLMFSSKSDSLNKWEKWYNGDGIFHWWS